MSLSKLIEAIPKAELHVHIEGTLEPELIMTLAQRNDIAIPYESVEEIRSAYQFTDLQSFLDVYHLGTQVLREQQDFYDMTTAYLQRAAEDKVRHTEIFIDTQTHTDRGIPFDTVIHGIGEALKDGQEKLGISSHMILCFLRHLSATEAENTFAEALEFKEHIKAFGLASSEIDNPPSRFAAVFEKARNEGFLTVAHAGEEGPPAYIEEALDLLHVARIDHGVRCLEDPQLVKRLAREQIPLTVCPLSNVKLCVFESLEQHNLKQLMDAGLKVTINSDDPSYFGGYIEENFKQTQQALQLDQDAIYALARNAFESSFVSVGEKVRHIEELDAVFQSFD